MSTRRDRGLPEFGGSGSQPPDRHQTALDAGLLLQPGVGHGGTTMTGQQLGVDDQFLGDLVPHHLIAPGEERRAVATRLGHVMGEAAQSACSSDRTSTMSSPESDAMTYLLGPVGYPVPGIGKRAARFDGGLPGKGLVGPGVPTHPTRAARGSGRGGAMRPGRSFGPGRRIASTEQSVIPPVEPGAGALPARAGSAVTRAVARCPSPVPDPPMPVDRGPRHRRVGPDENCGAAPGDGATAAEPWETTDPPRASSTTRASWTKHRPPRPSTGPASTGAAGSEPVGASPSMDSASSHASPSPHCRPTGIGSETSVLGPAVMRRSPWASSEVRRGLRSASAMSPPRWSGGRSGSAVACRCGR